MNKETQIVFDYYLQHPEFLEAIKQLSFDDMIYYMKKDIALDEYVELTQAQIDLFHTVINNINWYEVITELENNYKKGGLKK